MTDPDFSNFKREGLVGIAPASFIQRRIEAIRTSAYDPPPDDPVVWVRSKEELQRILKNPFHCQHKRVSRAVNGQEVPRSKSEQKVRKEPPDIDAEQADCVHRLTLLLEEMAKDYPKRRAFVRQIVQEDTQFSLQSVYVGRADPRNRWLVRSVHPIGLAALDPWFQDHGLSPSAISRPGTPPEPDSLDVGVLVRTQRLTWKRCHIFDIAVYRLFGIDKIPWIDLCDVRAYPRLERDPEHVLEKLHRLTHKTHSPKFTGAALT